MKEQIGRTRRHVLKSGLVISGVIGLGAVPVSGQTTVTGGGDALQTAIDDADDGDTIVVADSSVYDPITIDSSISVTTEADPVIAGEEVTAAVGIEADDVTLRGFTVTNPGGLLGIRVGRSVNGTRIESNTVEDIGPTGRLGVTGVLVGQGDHDGITISNNTIQQLEQKDTRGEGFPTLNGILFDAAATDVGTVTDISIANNTIRDLKSDIAPLGIVVQHETDGVGINNNRITDLVATGETDRFSFTFAQGINIDSPSTANTAINRNVFDDITSAQAILPEAVKVDGDGGGLTLRANQFRVAIGVNNRNGTDGGDRDPAGDPVVDARNNWWGSSDGPTEASFNQDADGDPSDVIGNVEFEPFLRNPPGGGRGSGGNAGRGRGSEENPGRGQGAN